MWERTALVRLILAWHAGQSEIMRPSTDLPGTRWWTTIDRFRRPDAPHTLQA